LRFKLNGVVVGDTSPLSGSRSGTQSDPCISSVTLWHGNAGDWNAFHKLIQELTNQQKIAIQPRTLY
jgi:hypothetical protein